MYIHVLYCFTNNEKPPEVRRLLIGMALNWLVVPAERSHGQLWARVALQGTKKRPACQVHRWTVSDGHGSLPIAIKATFSSIHPNSAGYWAPIFHLLFPLPFFFSCFPHPHSLDLLPCPFDSDLPPTCLFPFLSIILL
jgi:hypothetical protein